MVRDIPLILRALRKHVAVCSLIVVQIAIACAVLGNGLNLVGQRYQLQGMPTGMAEERLIALDVEALQGRIDKVQHDEVVRAVSVLPGVESVASVNTLPFSGRGGTFKFVHSDEFDHEIDGALYYGSAGFMDTLGVQVMAGHGFVAEDFRSNGSSPLAEADKIILSESLARRLSASVGSRVEVAGRGLMVVGISRDVMAPVLVDPVDASNTAFIPSPPSGIESARIIVSANPDDLPALATDVSAAATRVTPDTLIWSARQFSEIRDDYFRLDRTMIRLILGFGILLAVVVAGGVGGLSSFWIARRNKQIAIRRALGARRRDIAWYFHAENLFVTSLGVLLGFAGAVALSAVLTEWMGLPSMPIGPLAWGALAMVIVGQLAVVMPVRRAVAVPPGALKAL